MNLILSDTDQHFIWMHNVSFLHSNFWLSNYLSCPLCYSAKAVFLNGAKLVMRCAFVYNENQHSSGFDNIKKITPNKSTMKLWQDGNVDFFSFTLYRKSSNKRPSYRQTFEINATCHGHKILSQRQEILIKQACHTKGIVTPTCRLVYPTLNFNHAINSCILRMISSLYCAASGFVGPCYARFVLSRPFVKT